MPNISERRQWTGADATHTRRELRKMQAGDSKAREKAETFAREETARADRAEQSLRQLELEFLRMKRRAEAAEADLRSRGRRG